MIIDAGESTTTFKDERDKFPIITVGEGVTVGIMGEGVTVGIIGEGVTVGIIKVIVGVTVGVFTFVIFTIVKEVAKTIPVIDKAKITQPQPPAASLILLHPFRENIVPMVIINNNIKLKMPEIIIKTSSIGTPPQFLNNVSKKY